jgi:Holliday junction resolvase
MEKTERQIKEEIVTFLKLRNVYCVRQNANCGTKIGVPDLLTCINGRFVAIETKKKGGFESVAQKVSGESIQNNGGFYLVIDNIEDFKEKYYQIKSF